MSAVICALMHPRSYSNTDALWAALVITAFITTTTVIYCHQRNLCLLTVTLTAARAGGFSVFLMACKVPPCSFNTSRTAAHPGNDRECIISADAVIEAATSNFMLPWPFFSFAFLAQLKDELCKKVYSLSVGTNKDAAAFSSEAPFVVSEMDLETAVTCARTTLWVRLCHCVANGVSLGNGSATCTSLAVAQNAA